jgi:transposase
MIPSDARVWIAMEHTDMRKGMQGLALLVQQGLKRDPMAAIYSCSAGAPDLW